MSTSAQVHRKMAPSPLDKQPVGYKSPYNWLVRLAMDLAVLLLRPHKIDY